MAAAYAALVSLTNTLHQILHPPPTLHIIFDRKQIETLQQKANLLIDFLEKQSSNYGGGNKEIEHLETMIGDAAYAAEYIIEFNVMNQILAARSRSNREESSNLLFEGLEISIQEFLFIEKELVKFKKAVQRPNNNSSSTEVSSSSRPLLPNGKNIMVGFDNHVTEIMGDLCSSESHLRIISIVGMGGIGKTTLATNVFKNSFIVEHVQLRAWFVVSQECTGKHILLGLLNQINTTGQNELEMSDGELGLKLHKTLFGRKYLIVMDDMWDTTAWEIVKRFLPDNNNGSRILVTTRLLKLAMDIGSCTPYQLNFLDEVQGWDLLRQMIFADGYCPVELEGVGKRIAKKCRGLPLALVVIGGVLENSKTEEHWVSIEKDVTSAVNNEDDEFCMKILSLSYNHLPIYLKPCFLYFAVFPQDYNIEMPRLVRLWVAEGFIRKCGHKSLEEIGEQYLEDLINRNLIWVDTRTLIGEVNECRIHDLLSDLCRREAQKDNFILIENLNILRHTKSTPRLSNNGCKWKGTKFTPYRPPLPTRSFLSFSSKGDSTYYTARQVPLLRVLDVVDKHPEDEILKLINSRYVSCNGSMSMPSSISSRLWSLQTLVVDKQLILPSEIWQMPQLRNIYANPIFLPDPPPLDNVHEIILLENLQTLSTVKDFKCTEAVINRIPNVKKMRIMCETIGSDNCLRNIGLLHKLEEIYLECPPCGGDIVFPNSLKQLSLRGSKIPWEDMSVVGSLPNLEILMLWTNAAVGSNWIPNEGEFAKLKYLLIQHCELEIWEADHTHFPSLEQLHLGYLNLKEIPSKFARIYPLQVIKLDNNRNNDLILASLTGITEERENEGYDAVRVEHFSVRALGIWVKSGINLVAGGGDPYVVITTMDNQVVKTRVVSKDVNPEWEQGLTIYLTDHFHPISLTVYGHNKLGMDEIIGEAEFDVEPLSEVAKMNLDETPDNTIIRRIMPASSNCLAEESVIAWKYSTIMQPMCLQLKPIECGQVRIQLEWLSG